jgi:hypothetical protein
MKLQDKIKIHTLLGMLKTDILETDDIFIEIERLQNIILPQRVMKNETN